VTDDRDAIATVTAAYGRRGRLETATGDALRYLVQGRRLRVVCGDRVIWRTDRHGKEAIVTAICERENQLERLPPDRPHPEILAANLSCLIVVFAPQPETDWHLIDRYLVTGELMGCRLVLVDNKSDTLDAAPGPKDALKSRREAIEPYIALGYEYLAVSAKSGHGIAELIQTLSNETAILVGQSGVGKSSLINCLVPGADIAVGELSAASAEGTHTTTASAMHPLPDGGQLIDTPGVRDFVPAVGDPARVQLGFPEIRERADDCRFADCRHLREPDCAVKKAVESGDIHPRRYETYRRLARSD